MNNIKLTDAVKLIKESKGKFFTVDFITKSGEIRKMNCRLGVKKHLTGQGLKFDPNELGYQVVFDAVKKQYRMINLQTILKLSINNKNYIVT